MCAKFSTEPESLFWQIKDGVFGFQDAFQPLEDERVYEQSRS